MKPCMHLVEISIFSLNNVTIRLTKIMNNLLEHGSNLSKKPSLKDIGLGDQLLLKKYILKSFFFLSILFSKNVPNFVHNFGRSDGDII